MLNDSFAAISAASFPETEMHIVSARGADNFGLPCTSLCPRPNTNAYKRVISIKAMEKVRIYEKCSI